MASLRTAADIQAEYTAARAAYLNAVDSASYSIGTRSKQNQDIEKLHNEMNRLEAEYQKITNGGISVTGITPTY